MKPKVVIKKYSNRRLYDMEQKRYITLDELTERIKSGVEVEVLDSKTGEDLTQQVLIQVILESQKVSGNYLFSNELLHQLIQYQEQSRVEFFQRYVPMLFQGYLQWQEEAQNQFLHWAKLGWSASAFTRDFPMPGFPAMWGSYRSSDTNGPADNGVGESAEELEMLRHKVREMEARKPEKASTAKPRTKKKKT